MDIRLVTHLTQLQHTDIAMEDTAMDAAVAVLL
jgi:hypothetical protein